MNEFKPKLFFLKNSFELKSNEVETAIQTESILFFRPDFQLEELKYQRCKLNNGSIIYYYIDKDEQKQCDFYAYYSTGELFITANYVNNKLNGKCTIYFKDGTPKSVSYYKNGEINGDSYLYTNNGNLVVHEYFKDLKLNGLSKRWCINHCCVNHLHYEDNIIKHIDKYVNNILTESFDLTEEESKKYDLEIKKFNNIKNNIYYDIYSGNILQLYCTNEVITKSNPKKSNKRKR